MKRSKSEEKEAEEILEICSKTYAKAEKEGKLDDLEMIRDLIKELGEKGFTAVDSENQVNMTEYENSYSLVKRQKQRKWTHDRCRKLQREGAASFGIWRHMTEL